MKKLCLILVMSILFIGCRKDFINPAPPTVVDNLKISQSVGLKLETPFVTSEVAMNVKVNAGQNVTIKIFDIANRVVSKEQMYVNSGDNILKVYTTALPASAYRIGLFDTNNNMLAITDFNKL